MRYQRVLLKLSGEALMGEQNMGIDPSVVAMVADQIKDIQKHGVEVGLVIGLAIFFEASLEPPKVWIASPLIKWVCWRP